MKITTIYIVASVLLLAALAGCMTMGDSGTADERAIAKGIEAWNEKSPAAAKAYWNGIKDVEANKKYMGYLSSYNTGAKILSDTSALKSSEHAKLLSSCKSSIKAFSALDKSLQLPAETRKAGLALTEGRVRALIASDQINEARALSTSAEKVYGTSEALSAMNRELDVILASRDREAEADATAEKARATAGENFEEKLAAFEASITAYEKAENALVSDTTKSGVAKNAGVVKETKSLKKKHQQVNVERETLLRERAYYYKNRIGEEFARVPEKGKSGNMTLEEILKHQESVKANVNEVYKEMETFAARYPDVIGQDILDEITEQKKDLDAKIAQINKEILTAKEIASRGKVAMPIMIGLFNPQPTTKEESKKSRPAVFSANNAKKAEYWWGMVSIPKNEMNDLVITLKDNRTVRVFSENTKSGSLIEKKKLPDLVNRTYRIGNSWPVLNAGSQLASDKYFFEVQPGKTPEYEGEAVVYSSFIVRMR